MYISSCRFRELRERIAYICDNNGLYVGNRPQEGGLDPRVECNRLYVDNLSAMDLGCPARL